MYLYLLLFTLDLFSFPLLLTPSSWSIISSNRDWSLAYIGAMDMSRTARNWPQLFKCSFSRRKKFQMNLLQDSSIFLTLRKLLTCQQQKAHGKRTWSLLWDESTSTTQAAKHMLAARALLQLAFLQAYLLGLIWYCCKWGNWTQDRYKSIANHHSIQGPGRNNASNHCRSLEECTCIGYLCPIYIILTWRLPLKPAERPISGHEYIHLLLLIMLLSMNTVTQSPQLWQNSNNPATNVQCQGQLRFKGQNINNPMPNVNISWVSRPGQRWNLWQQWPAAF